MNSNATVDNSLLQGNTVRRCTVHISLYLHLILLQASESGGAIAVFNFKSGLDALIANDTVFEGNFATKAGGAVFEFAGLQTDSKVVFDATNDSFLRNRAVRGSLFSCAAACSHSLPQLTNGSVLYATEQLGVASFTTDTTRDQNVYQGNNPSGVSTGACVGANLAASPALAEIRFGTLRLAAQTYD